jgi:hypothetical protein
LKTIGVETGGVLAGGAATVNHMLIMGRLVLTHMRGNTMKIFNIRQYI